jgi:glycosyltransferase involved in cell wall biosynthesis
MNSVTVLMPVRNGSYFLRDSIQCIEANTTLEDEIIVIDDRSTDQTGSILKSWSQQNNRVRVLQNPGKGLVDALNHGINESSNDWIARFDVDDKYTPDRILKQRSLISQSVSAIFCDYDFLTPFGHPLGIVPTAIDNSSTVISLISSQRTPHPGALIKKESLVEVGGYRSLDYPAEDISLWLRLAKVGHLISVPEVLLHYQISRNSISALKRTDAQRRTRELFYEIGLNKEVILDGLSNWQNIFESYSKLALSSERKILFFRDLRNSLKHLDLHQKYSREVSKIRGEIALDPSNVLPFLGLVRDKLQRNIYRGY